MARRRLSQEPADAVVPGLLDGQARDPRMTLPERPGEIPREALLGRRSLVLAPWIVVALTSVAYAGAELLRERASGTTWKVVIGALTIGAVSAVLAFSQDREFALRFRRTLWVYALGGAAILATLAIIAVYDQGVLSIVYAGICPLATYFGLVAPRRWRLVSLTALLLTTVLVEVAHPAPELFDAAIMLMVTAASWFCGVMVSVGHEHTVRVIRRLASHDRRSGSLSRRGFMQQLEYALHPQTVGQGAVALLLIGIDRREGQDEDEFLGWVGSTVGPIVPEAAEFGRLSDDEFAVLLPDLPRHRAEETARDIRRALEVGGRADVRIGVATSEIRSVAAADLVRVAYAAQARAAGDVLGVQSLVAGTADVPRGQAPPLPSPPVKPTLSYASIRRTGQVPRGTESQRVYRRLITWSLIAVGLAGVPVIVREYVGERPGTFDDLLRYFGPVWVMFFLGLAVATHRRWKRRGDAFDLFVVVASGSALGAALAIAALADRGLEAPIVGAFFVYVVYGAAILSRKRAVLTLGLMLAGWFVVAALGPAASLWVFPFHLSLFAGCFLLGAVGNHAMDETAALARRRAVSDHLTQRPNRAGFLVEAEEAFFVAATQTGTPFALLTFRIADLRAFNERRGYGAGDALLREMGDLLDQHVPDAFVVGRTAATEFSVALSVVGGEAAAGMTRDLAASLSKLAPVTAAHAICPKDGATVEALMAATRHDLPHALRVA